MLKQVQHDKGDCSCFCHPEPCPELDSGLIRDLGFGFGINSLLVIDH
jgi:hypothetical protein